MGIKSHRMNTNIKLKDTKSQPTDTRNPHTAMKNPRLDTQLLVMITILVSDLKFCLFTVLVNKKVLEISNADTLLLENEQLNALLL